VSGEGAGSPGREIRSVAMIGAGTMGWQIAARTADSGRTVALYDALPGAAERAIERMRTELDPAVRAAGKAERWDVPALLGRVRAVGSLEDAVAGVDLVIEAVREHLPTKLEVFRELDRLAPAAILATNSSSLPSGRLVEAVSRPERLVNLHFFSPIWQREMLEVMSCGRTDEAVLRDCVAFGRSLGLITIGVQGESMGFVINRVWRAVKREALRVVDEGHAAPEDVDRLWMGFFGTPYGPFGLMDLVGLDVVRDIEASYVAVTQDPTDRVSPTLRRLVEAGKLGEKSGEGFYRHPDPAYLEPGFLTGKTDAEQT
jgi:3-hydroxybutyryl-CoA dehydrogenase